ncbi:Ank domain-containing protein/Pkinase domain-containing protein/zf-C3HC4 domain-containing protein/Ank_2 domain-containing protein/Ank_4 domain-containing protein [Cephalotus follicularis]|uniref:RING-type E3 ubiquitin transferase n=1 Tax=Cephalotus follicularis TaxID=3775 RepID=A0A1Q3BNX8_CEPFO|nr:Ank domain-containing protein/Pkinase domain-containing protein/zf-C3HC4 domain-containing protein/Ank_2 domain-containing protein/Ank_4 domain-containing protein [Cephalotus follicularis]
MKVPCCSICQTRYNEDERVPLLLQCGHGFCNDCLSRMFSSSPDTTLACPRCRHVSLVGNSVLSLRKNFAVLALIHSASSSPAYCDYTDDEEDEGGVDDDDTVGRCSRGSHASSSGNCGPVIEVGSHQEVKLVRNLGEGRRGMEMWTAVIGGSHWRCKHRLAVKKVAVGAGEEIDLEWVMGQLDNLRRMSMWCRNVCTFHGTLKMEGCLGLVMDRCYGSVQSEMQRNEGRLTLEQILRYGADVARGVAELHAAGVVCMNLKPSNLLLDTGGHAVVSDYGLAAILKKPVCRKARSECETSRIHSCMDCTMLTPNYTAPEAWEPVKKSLNLFWDDAIGISAESDAWSFGCTLVEMCTGSIPWAGLSAEEIFRAVVKARKLPPQYASVVGVGIPRDLWKMIGECLQFKASKRPSFQAMLAIFLRHLQEIPRSPPGSPDNGFMKFSGSNVTEPSPASDLVFNDNPTDLHQLVSEGDVSGVRDILAKTASINGSCSISSLLAAQNADGQTALHLACRRGSAELVEALLEYPEANVDVLDKDGDPSLVFALAAGSPECVHALIERGAIVRSRSGEGFGPSIAHVCAYHGQPDCMRELLLAGTDPNAVDDEGESVLHRAVAKKYTDCALVILENGGCRSMAVLNSKSLTPLHLCIATWNVAVVRRWVEVGTPEEITIAIDIPSPVGTALCMAATLKKDHEIEGRELVRILLAAGADPTAQDTQHGRTALHTAAMANDVELVKIILDAGVDPNIRNLHNTIPIHVALARGANSCVGLLLSAGANYNLQDDEGDNAFHIAADAAKMIRENLGWLIVMLRNPDAAVEVRNHSGKTLRDYLEALPREWISEDLMDALINRGVHLSPTIFEVGDWVKYKRSVTSPMHGWQGAKHMSVGFVQSVLDRDNLIVSFCLGEAHVLANEVIKVIPLDRGQHVQLKADVKEPRFGWRGQSRDSIGTVLCVDDDGILRVGFPGASRGWKADPAEMERVEEFKVGDWVRIRPTLTTAKHGLGSVTPGSIGIVYCIRPDSSLLLELSYLPNPWHCEPEEVEPVAPFRIGDQVCVKRSVAEPRYAWGGETHHSVGRISEIENDGLLIIEIPNRPIPWQADPSDMEKVEDFKVGDWVRVKASVSSPKYGWEDITRNSIGIIHSLEEDGDIGVAFCFRSKPFCCSVTDIEKVPPFEVGQEIHVLSSVTQPRLGWSNETPATVGKIVRIDMDGALNVRVLGRQKLWKVSPGDAERLSGFEVGDWVRSKPSLGTRPSYDWNTIGKESLAVVHSVQDTGYLELACCFRKGRWITHYTDVEKVPSYKVGQHVHFRAGLVEPRWGWRGAQPGSRGIIINVHADGEVRVAFFGLPGLWRGDPADLEIHQMFEVGEWVRLRENAIIWKSIRPGSVGVVQGLRYEGDEWDGSTFVGFCGEQEKWVGPTSHLERVERLGAGQKVRVKLSVKQPRFGWSGHSNASVGTISAIDADGKLRIYTTAGFKTWMLDPSEVMVVEEEELCIGDWVRVKASVSTPMHQWGEVNHSSIGVVHRMEDGELWVAFCFMERLWLCKVWEMERVRPFKVGDKVRIREGLVTPRWGWGMETHVSQGQVVGVDSNGKLRIKFQWREGKPWIGDPADIVLDESYSFRTGAS